MKISTTRYFLNYKLHNLVDLQINSYPCSDNLMKEV